MNAIAMPEKPQKWDWIKWLYDLARKYDLRAKPNPYGLIMPRVYRIFVDNSCALVLGELISNGGFYSVYETACNHFPQYTDTLCVIDIQTGWAM